MGVQQEISVTTYNLLPAVAMFFVAVLHEPSLIQMRNSAVRTLERVAIRTIATKNNINSTQFSSGSAYHHMHWIQVNHLYRFIVGDLRSISMPS